MFFQGGDSLFLICSDWVVLNTTGNYGPRDWNYLWIFIHKFPYQWHNIPTLSGNFLYILKKRLVHFIWKSYRKRERNREKEKVRARERPNAGLIQSPDSGVSPLTSMLYDRDSNTWATLWFFPQVISKELYWKWVSWDVKQCSVLIADVEGCHFICYTHNLFEAS